MRDIATCLARIRCDLPCSEQELYTVREWLDKKKKEQDRVVVVTIIAAIILPLIIILMK